MEMNGQDDNDLTKKGLTLILGGCNFVTNAPHTNIILNGETLEAIAVALEKIPPDAASELSQSIGSLAKAISTVITKIGS